MVHGYIDHLTVRTQVQLDDDLCRPRELAGCSDHCDYRSWCQWPVVYTCLGRFLVHGYINPSDMEDLGSMVDGLCMHRECIGCSEPCH